MEGYIVVLKGIYRKEAVYRGIFSTTGVLGEINRIRAAFVRINSTMIVLGGIYRT